MNSWIIFIKCTSCISVFFKSVFKNPHTLYLQILPLCYLGFHFEVLIGYTLDHRILSSTSLNFFCIFSISRSLCILGNFFWSFSPFLILSSAVFKWSLNPQSPLYPLFTFEFLLWAVWTICKYWYLRTRIIFLEVFWKTKGNLINFS